MGYQKHLNGRIIHRKKSLLLVTEDFFYAHELQQQKGAKPKFYVDITIKYK